MYNQQHQPSKFKMKVDIQLFDGKVGIKGFLDWINYVETFFEYMNVPKGKKVKIASAWWE